MEIVDDMVAVESRVPTTSYLTHHPMDKMDAILADDIFKCIFLNENNRTAIKISLKFVPRSPIDNKPALVQVMAWYQRGDKPLPEPVLTQFTDAYICGTRGRKINQCRCVQFCPVRRKVNIEANPAMVIYDESSSVQRRFTLGGFAAQMANVKLWRLDPLLFVQDNQSSTI